MKRTFAAVQVTNYLGRGAEYAAKLFAGVRRNVPASVDLRCVCFTDDPSTVPEGVEALPVPSGLVGWWSKLALFQPGVFEPGEQVIFSDLDMVMLGDVSDFAEYDGVFAAARDAFWPERTSSALMSWQAGKLDHIWTHWDEAGRPSFDRRGDQFWIETMQPEADYWQDFLPDQLVSFKRHCLMTGKQPANARVLMFHGLPRPHEVDLPWVKQAWEGRA